MICSVGNEGRGEVFGQQGTPQHYNTVHCQQRPPPIHPTDRDPLYALCLVDRNRVSGVNFLLDCHAQTRIARKLRNTPMNVLAASLREMQRWWKT